MIASYALKSRSPLWTSDSPFWYGDRHFELAIRYFELAIRYFELAFATMKSRSPLWTDDSPLWIDYRHFELWTNDRHLNWRLYHCPKRLPAHYAQYGFHHFHVGFSLSNLFLCVFVQRSFTLLYSSGSTEHWSERWAHFNLLSPWIQSFWNFRLSFFTLTHGIRLSLRQLKRILRNQGLFRRRNFSKPHEIISAVERELCGKGVPLAID